MILIYRLIGFILIPFIKLNLITRLKSGKESNQRYKERFGITNIIPPKNKKIIWIHAASVGEFKSADFFIQTFYKKYTLLVTTTTISSAQYAAKNYQNKIIHQFAPLDVFIWVNKFIKYWKPSFIIWIESDLWPVTLNTIKQKNIKAILVNLRMSPKSLSRWKKLPNFFNQTINCFSEIFVQSLNDKKRISLLTKRNIKFIGNMKIASLDSNFKRVNIFNSDKNNKTVSFMLASTHINEENTLLPIIKKILTNHKNIKVVIAPRHPERSKKIKSLCKTYGLTVSLESENNHSKSDIIIIDSFGILSKYFAESDIVFLGGSLTSNGGHNPIEPAIYKCAILTGPKIFNWENIFEDMINNEACIKIKSLEELYINLNNLINNKNKMNEMKLNAYNFSKKQFVNTKVLENLINNHMISLKC